MYEIIDEVRRFYQEVGEAFLLPKPEECIMYAITEMGEVVDAVLREQRPHDNRRRTDKSNVKEEMGDVALMLCASLNAVDYRKYIPAEDTGPVNLQQLCFQIAAAWLKYDTGNWIAPVMRALSILYRFPNYDVLTSLRSRMLKIKRERLETE